MTKIKETTEYDNCLDVKASEEMNSLTKYLDLSEDEKKSLEEDESKEWKKLWKGMPEFDQENNPPYKKLIISFRSKEDYDEFAKLVDQALTEKTKSIWYPKLDRDANRLLRWIEEND